MQPQVGVKRNLWARQKSGLFAPKRMNFPLDSLAFYLPAWHPELSGNTIVSKDLNARSGTVVGAVHYPNVGRWFDKTDDKITFGDICDLNGANLFTILAWVKLTDEGAAQVIVCKRGGDANYWLFRLSTLGKLAFIWNGGGAAESTTADYDDNTWHLVGIKGKDTAYTWLADGGTDGAAAESMGDQASTNVLLVGQPPTDADVAAGYIAEIWIYDREITTTENTDIYNKTKGRYA